MEKIPQEEIRPQTGLTSPPSQKRARTSCSATEDLSEPSQFLDISQDVIGSLWTAGLQRTDGLVAAECGQYLDEKHWSLSSDVDFAAHVTSVLMTGARSESYEVCVSAEGDEKHFAVKTSPPSNNTPGAPACKPLERSPENETPGSCGVRRPNDENQGTQSHPSLIQAVNFSSDQADHTFSQLAQAVEMNLKREEAHFRENSPLRKDAGGRPTSWRGFQDALQLCSSGEGDLSQTCSKGSSPGYESGRNTSVENVRFEDHNYVSPERSAGTPVAAGISQERAGGDNEADAFSVIDPVIWSEIDKKSERLLCSSDSTAGGALSPLVNVCKVETTSPLCSEGRTSQDSSSEQTKHLQDLRTAQLGDNYPTRTKAQACPATNNETQDLADIEGNRQRKSSPAKPPPAGCEGGEEVGVATLSPQVKAQGLSGCLAVSPACMETLELPCSEVEPAGIKQKHLPKDTDADDLEKTIQPEEELGPQSKPGGCISDQGGRETQTHGSKLQNIDGEQENKLGEACRANICIVNVTAEGGQLKQADFGGEMNSSEVEELQRESGEDVQDEDELRDGEGSPCPDVSEWVERRLAFCDGCFAHDRHTPEISTLCTVPLTTDAVVPCQPLNAPHRSTSPKSSLTYFPSCFTPCNRVLGGVDTFEKIKLSPYDDDTDDAAGLSTMPVLSSRSREQLITPQEQTEQRGQAAEGEIPDKTLVKGDEEEMKEKEGPWCCTDNMAEGFFPGDSWEVPDPNFVSAADVSTPTQPEIEPNCRSAFDSSLNGLNPQSVSSAAPSECDSPSSDQSYDFKTKEQFNRVLKELSLFFDISRNDNVSDCGPSSPEPHSDFPESSEGTSKPTGHLRSPERGRYAFTSTDTAAEDHSLVMCGVDPVVSCPVSGSDGEQEVPLIRCLEQEPLMDTEEKNKESQGAELTGKIWTPSFMRLPHFEQLSCRPTELPRRLEPLQTCTRPIRVGLSRRAKTKQLHHLHPYK